MLVTMASTFILGRFFCGWACHLMAYQDFSSWLLSKVKIKLKPIRSRFLIWLPVLLFLYLYIWPHIMRIFKGFSFIPLSVTENPQGVSSLYTNDLMHSMPSLGTSLLTFFVCGMVTVLFLGSRSFCSTVCPYGVFFGFLDRFSVGKIILKGSCENCGICTVSCKSGVKVIQEVKKYGAVVDTSCMKSFDCLAGCPQDAIGFGWGKPSLLTMKKKKSTTYSLSAFEEILLVGVFFVCLGIFRGLYDDFGLLLCFSLSAIIGYLSVIIIRLLKKQDTLLGGKKLYKKGDVTLLGKCFFGFYVLLFLLVVHSGFYKYHSYLGILGFKEIQRSKKSMANKKYDREKLENSLGHLRKAYKIGLVQSVDMEERLASLYGLKGDLENEEYFLNRIVEKKPMNLKVKVRLMALLFNLEKSKDAMEIFDLSLRPNSQINSKSDSLIRAKAYSLLGDYYTRMRKLDKAMESLQLATQNNPTYFPLYIKLGYLYGSKREWKKAYESFSIGIKGGAGTQQVLRYAEEIKKTYLSVITVVP